MDSGLSSWTTVFRFPAHPHIQEYWARKQTPETTLVMGDFERSNKAQVNAATHSKTTEKATLALSGVPRLKVDSTLI